MPKYHNDSCSKCNDYRRQEVTDEILDEKKLKDFVNETKKTVDSRETTATGIQTMECPKCKTKLFNILTDLHPNMVIPDYVWNAL